VESLSPIPKIRKVRPRTRKAQTTAVITSSPYKAELQKKQESSVRKSRKAKPDKSTAKGDRTSKSPDQSKESTEMSTKAPTKRKKSAKGQAKKSRKNEEEQDDTPCCICSKKYNAEPFQDFVQCAKCCAWYCEPCGPADINICYNCLP